MSVPTLSKSEFQGFISSLMQVSNVRVALADGEGHVRMMSHADFVAALAQKDGALASVVADWFAATEAMRARIALANEDLVPGEPFEINRSGHVL